MQKRESDTLMYREAEESADAVARQLERNRELVRALGKRLRESRPRFIATCARGSSDHAATFAKYVFETRLGVVTASASPSVSSVYETRQDFTGALYVAISQSGRSPDLLNHAKAAKSSGAHVVALVNVEDSPLALLADTVVPLHAGPERSVAATKSFICALSAILHIAAEWGEDAALLRALDDVPAALRDTFARDWFPLSDGLVDARNLFVIGRGLGFAIAQEAALKLKETCGLHGEAFSAAEVKHGPMTLVGPGFPVLVFAQHDETWESTTSVAHEFRARGAHVWLAASGETGHDVLPVGRTAHPACEPLAAIVGFYRAANRLALRRKRNPDVPPHLSKVTETV